MILKFLRLAIAGTSGWKTPTMKSNRTVPRFSFFFWLIGWHALPRRAAAH